MHGARVGDEVLPCPRIASEELGRKEIALEAITAATGENDVARHMRAAMRQRMYVIQGCEIELERSRAVHTSAAAVAHGSAFDRSFLVARLDCLGPAIHAGSAGEGHTVKVPTS